MIIDLFVKSLKNRSEYYYNDILININKKKKMTLFNVSKYEISIIIEADPNEINNICDFIINQFQKETESNGKISINANWYIFNNIANKDQFNKLNTENNQNYRKMFNKYCLINNITGDVYFNPDKIENNVISERMKFLYNEYNKNEPLDYEKEETFAKELSPVYEILNLLLNDLRWTYTRKII